MQFIEFLGEEFPGNCMFAQRMSLIFFSSGPNQFFFFKYKTHFRIEFSNPKIDILSFRVRFDDWNSGTFGPINDLILELANQ